MGAEASGSVTRRATVEYLLVLKHCTQHLCGVCFEVWVGPDQIYKLCPSYPNPIKTYLMCAL